MDAASLWEKILNVYKTHITKQFYESFFSSIEPVTVRKNKLILLAPNYFIKEVIENNHLNNLHNIAKDVSSTSYEIQIILDLEEITDMYSDSDSDNGKDIRSYSLNPKYTFDTGIPQTIDWYLNNKEWWQNILSGEYANYFDKMYGNRL